MRLVIDGRRLSSHRTGVGRYLETLLEGWTRCGFPAEETFLALSDPAGLAFVPKSRGLTAAVLRPRGPGLFWEIFGLGRNLRRGDLLFAPGNLIPATWRGPTVLTVHDLLQEVRPEDFPRQVRWRFGLRYRDAARRADRILVPSQSTAEDLARIYGIPHDRIRVIPPAPGAAFRPADAASPLVHSAREAIEGLADRPFFLFVGKKSKRRHVPDLVAAFRRFQVEDPDHRLVLVGPGREPGAGSNVIQPGHVAESVLRGLLASAVALFYPSEYEGFGLPVVEAMASGCPVVTLRNSALAEVGGDAPLFLETADEASLLDAMRAMTRDPSGRADQVSRGLAQAARFRPDAFAVAVRDELRAFLPLA